MKNLIIGILAGWAFVALLGQAEPVLDNWRLVSPFERCLNQFEGSEHETQCHLLK